MTTIRIPLFFVSLALVACRGGTDPHAGHAIAPASAHGEHGEHAGHDEHAGHAPVGASPPRFDTSLFQLESRFTDLSGAAFPLARLRGEPSLVVMFYGTCTTICPVLVEDAKATLAALPESERARVKLVLVTFDPERDTPERLGELARDHGLDLARTVMLRGASDSDVRELSAVLGVQYRKLADGNFAHSAVLSLLDGDGRIVERIEGLGQSNATIVERVHSLIGAVN